VQHEPLHVSNAAVESMRSLGNTLNPLNRFAGMNVMRSFGRSSGAAPPTTATSEKTGSGLLGTSGKDRPTTAAALASQAPAPPIQRFLDITSASELRIGDIEELLKDYQRLASALQQSGCH
jgi:hypothetical protein